MQYSRSHRRHHRERLIAKRFKEDARWGTDAVNYDTWSIIHARKRARTACLCTCWLCGNPRRHYGNSVAALTRQELRSPTVADFD